jgi:hypothetical protein
MTELDFKESTLKFDAANWSKVTDFEAEARESRVRARMAKQGYRLMHRRNGQYWVMFDEPKTLDEIEVWIESQMTQ